MIFIRFNLKILKAIYEHDHIYKKLFYVTCVQVFILTFTTLILSINV